MATQGQQGGQGQRKTSRKNQLKQASHFHSSVVNAAREGRRFAWTDQNGTLVVGQQGQVRSPYFNKADGIPGQDTLQLNANNFDAQRQKGRDLVFVLSHRIVGTQQEIADLFNRAGITQFSLNDLLRADNVVTAANMGGQRQSQVLAQETQLQSDYRRRAKTEDDEMLAELERVYQRRLANNAARGKGPKKSPRQRSTGDAAATRLVTAFNRDNNLIDVSRNRQGGRSARKITKTPGEGSSLRNVPGRFGRIYASNEEDYVQALQDLGASQDEINLHVQQLRQSLAGRKNRGQGGRSGTGGAGAQGQAVSEPNIQLMPDVLAQPFPTQTQQTGQARVSPSRVTTVIPGSAMGLSPSRVGQAPAAPLQAGASGTSLIRPLMSPRSAAGAAQVGATQASPVVPEFRFENVVL